MPDTSTLSAFSFEALLNAPDLVLIGIIVLCGLLGAGQGLIRTILFCFGRLAALAGAVFGAHLLAPIIARFLVTPIVGDVFRVRAASLFAHAPEAADSLETLVTEAAVSMAEGLAYFILLIVLLLSFTLLVGLIGRTLQIVADIGPLSILNRLGGLIIGLLFGLVLCFLLLWALHAFAPTVFSELGWLSPEQVSNTVLTARLLAFVPGYGTENLLTLVAAAAGLSL